MSLPPPILAPAGRVAPSATHAFGGVWRLTFRRFLLPSRWLGIGIGLAVLGLLCFAVARNGEFLEWSIEFYLGFLVPALSFIAAGGAMRDELKSGTIDYVLTRPIRRPAFLVFKYLSHTLCTQVDFLIAFALLGAFGVVHDVPNFPEAIPTLLFGQFLLVTAFSALGFLAGALTARYVVIGIGYAVLIEVGIGQIPTQLSKLSMSHQMMDLLATRLLPAHASLTAPSLVGTTAMLFALTAAALALAATVFSVRELSGQSES